MSAGIDKKQKVKTWTDEGVRPHTSLPTHTMPHKKFKPTQHAV